MPQLRVASLGYQWQYTDATTGMNHSITTLAIDSAGGYGGSNYNSTFYALPTNQTNQISPLWTLPLAAPTGFSAPALVGDLAIVTTSDGGLNFIDRRHGTLVAEYKLGASDMLPLAVAGGVVYALAGNTVVALYAGG